MKNGINLRWGRCLTIAALLAASLSVSGLASGDEVDTLFEEGTAALEKGNYAAAYEKLSAAFEKRKSVDIAANLALAEVKTGKKREAAEHLAYGLANFPATGDPKARKRMQAQLDDLKKGLCEVKVAAEGGSKVLVGNVAVGLAPLQSPLYVEPGNITVRVELEGRMGEQTVAGQAGDSLTIKVELTQTVGPQPTGTATGTGTTPPPPPEEKPLWPAIVLGGVAAVGAGVGIGLTVVGTGKYGSAEEARAACADPPTVACETTVTDEFDGANGLIAGGIVGLSVAGAALIGMTIYLAIPGDTPDEKAAANALFLPIIGPDQIGGQFGMRF